MTNILSIILMAPQGGQGGGSGSSMLIMLGLMGLVTYFFMIRPQTKKAKEAKTFREGLKKGDRIITIGGVHGKITEVGETTFVIESEGTKLKIEKSAVSPESSQSLNKPA